MIGIEVVDVELTWKYKNDDDDGDYDDYNDDDYDDGNDDYDFNDELTGMRLYQVVSGSHS